MSGYFPTKQQMAKLVRSLSEEQRQLTQQATTDSTQVQIVPGMVARTDSLDVNATLASLEVMFQQATDPVERHNLHGMYHRTASISDLTHTLYNRFCDNPNSIANWFPPLQRANADAGEPFWLPATKILRLPIELAQYLRLEYPDTTRASRELFNELIFNSFDLNEQETYFIKTGTFSSKFEFANAKCTEPAEMGDYFHVINNFAMQVGAGQTVDLCVREYLEDPEGNPTIYNGMPLRTEFRVFVDLDGATPRVLGVTPYWHPSVMEQALARAADTPGESRIKGDYQTYRHHKHHLARRFHKLRPEVTARCEALLPALRDAGLTGQWTVDVMASGDDLVLIDMALMCESALVEVLKVASEYSNITPTEVDEFAGKMFTDYGTPDVAFTGGFYDSDTQVRAGLEP